MGIKKAVVNMLALRPTSRGYTGKEARRWVRKVYRSYFKDKDYTFSQSRWAIKRGFTPEDVEALNINESNYRDTISTKEYAFLRPLNGGYSKWITDKVTINAVFKPFRDKMPKCYYQISKRDMKPFIIPLYDFSAGDSFDDVLDMIRERKRLIVSMSRGRRESIITYENGEFLFDDRTMSKSKLIEKLSSYQGTLVIKEDTGFHADFVGGILKLIVFNEQGDNPVIGESYITFSVVDDMKNPLPASLAEEDDLDEMDEDPEEATEDKGIIYGIVNRENGSIFDTAFVARGKKIPEGMNPNTGNPLPTEIPYWDDIKETVDKLCRFVPQLEYFGLNIVIEEDGFKITQMVNHPSYPKLMPFSPDTSKYLKYKVEQKKEAYSSKKVRFRRGCKKIKLKIRATYAKAFFPKGLIPYLSIRWHQDLRKDFRTNKDTTLGEKLWARRHGFISYRLHQYGITKDNYLNFISDFEYKYLRHINNKYRHWMEDKITVKYICSDYNQCFPEYYYHISMKNGNKKVIPMMDCPEDYGNSFEDIFRLVHEKGSLALKPDEGSHGDGFYKFEFTDGQYYLNHQPAEKDDVLAILEDVKNQYLVTEYIEMHHEIKRIYDGAVNTIRMIVFKKDGKNPEIGNAYMRFGSKRTGAVDNMGAGGMFARIDIETGRFYDSKIIEDNEIKSCLCHPDTGVKIEGYLPNWEKVKEQVLQVARNIPQLEYFGFDLALTEDGLKFPEINRFPDYPAIEKYTPKTIDYLLYKLEQKKKKYGYDVSRGHKLVKLPKR